MSSISIADRFLGSLMGAYLGHSYFWGSIGEGAAVIDSALYQSWLSPMPPIELPVGLSATFPWLLHHHDNRQRRAHYLDRYGPMEFLPVDDVDRAGLQGALCILGEALEWLMQCPPDLLSPQVMLAEYLRQQLASYSANVILQGHHVINELTHGALSDSSAVNHYGLCHHSVIALSIKQCLDYRENLALALASFQVSSHGSSLPMLIGYLLGAWRGPDIIPDPWLMLFSGDDLSALEYLAQQMYRNWAGMCPEATSFATFPLSL